ncbi:unnamed protein product [Brassicogethes aeneus]|uniref:Cytochrome b5 heme-binding domain-containing protein n=1 Tax=Brassicogethes aeneus TaxID=1431903 RepID=A0A9P0FQS5_BRAAE|nr:unnamed protein product [Brassicogethes aeneus]
MPPSETNPPFSSLGIIPPARRRGITQNGDIWLEDRQALSGAEGLWRIHDKLYDLSSFIDNHPGGPEWLQLSKGTDITEAFETHHLSNGPEKMLVKFFVKEAKTKRNSPYTFKNDGFYKTLKQEVIKKIKYIPKQSSNTTNFLIDSLLVGMFIFSILACTYWNFYIGALAGSFMAMTSIAAHNYFHRKDNFRMFYFHFSLMQVREWRISHVLSHHLYTNTVDDLEISSWEPFIQYLPIEKKPLVRYGSYIYAPLLWITSFHLSFIRRILEIKKGNMRHAQPTEWLGFLLPLVMFLISGQSLWWSFIMWNYILLCGSTHFFLVGLHAAHHHPDIFHDGDEPRSKDDLDWGLSQLDTVMDRKEINGSHFLVLTNFGDHALHHLFPTLDHGTLEHLYPIFEDVLERFNERTSFRCVSQVDTFTGSYQQISRISPNKNPPNLKKI